MKEHKIKMYNKKLYLLHNIRGYCKTYAWKYHNLFIVQTFKKPEVKYVLKFVFLILISFEIDWIVNFKDFWLLNLYLRIHTFKLLIKNENCNIAQQSFLKWISKSSIAPYMKIDVHFNYLKSNIFSLQFSS